MRNEGERAAGPPEKPNNGKERRLASTSASAMVAVTGAPHFTSSRAGTAEQGRAGISISHTSALAANIVHKAGHFVASPAP